MLMDHKVDRFLRLKRRVEALEKVYKDNPIVHSYFPKLSDLPCPPPAWKVYYRLKDALDHVDHYNLKEIRVFAVEPTIFRAHSGKREFIVASYKEFWVYYSQKKIGERHFYEIIKENALCHLYFDLEFSRVCNPYLDGLELLEKFLCFLFKKIEENFGIMASRKNVLDLDSSTDVKFSRHLILHLPNAVFRSNADVGRFVKQICVDSGGEFLVSGDEKLVSFVDIGVYSKNRNFRMFLSSKKGKNAVLIRSKDCCFDFSHQDILSSCCIFHAPNDANTPVKRKKIFSNSFEELIFYVSLITNVHERDDLKILTFGETQIPVKQSKNYVVSGDISSRKQTPCPYPAVEQFVMSLISNPQTSGEGRGYISKWTYFPDGATITFNIIGYRYCGNIGRHHKSNHIYYVADLKDGYCYQKCFDPVCVENGYRSSPVFFPKEILESITDEVTDSELIEHVDMLEKRLHSRTDDKL